ncbi:MAG: TetR/AcrR family transcriptional regulator, partial [Chlorobia bacterium]|nr:TetR/AcrR family transcriptional regulator [Fimbriimonadaceae bacterium]
MTEALKTRDRIIEAARDLFLNQGYNSTGLAQITQHAGVKSGSLYYFFPTKEDLLIAVLDFYRANIYEGLLKYTYERISDPLERVFGVLDGYRQMLLMTNFEMGCPIGNLVLEVTNSHPSVRPLMNTNFDQWVDAIDECFKASSRIPETVDTRDLAVFTLTTMEGAVMLARSYRDIRPFDQAIVQYRDYVERLVADEMEWSRP